MGELPSASRSGKPYQQSVFWLGAVLISAVFLVEALVMLVLHELPPLPPMVEVLLDAALLSLLLFPIFYFQVFRPLVHHIRERKRTEEELRIAAVAFEIREPILITDANANIVRANKMFLSVYGYSMEELRGQNPRILSSGRHDKAFYERLWQQLLSKGSWSGAIHNRNKRGQVNPLFLTITAVRNEQQEITHYVAIYNFG